MPYNPGISFDASPIANGLASAGQNIAQGLIERARKREEKEKWASAVKTLQPIVAEMSGGKIDLSQDTPKEAIPSLINLAENYQREQREAPLRKLQIENEQLRQLISRSELDQAAVNAAALKGSARYLADDPTRYQPTGIMKPGKDNTIHGAANAALALQSYVNQGGSDPRVLAQLGDLAAAQLRATNRPQPGLRNLGQAYGKDVMGVVDAQGNVKVIDDPNTKTGTPTQRKKLIEERDYFRSIGRDDLVAGYDEALANLDNREKPLTLNEFLVSPQLSGRFKDDYSAYRAAWSQMQGKLKSTTPGAADQPTRKLTAKEQQAYNWALANPDDPRAAKIRQELNLD